MEVYYRTKVVGRCKHPELEEMVNKNKKKEEEKEEVESARDVALMDI